jgi:hypothetical protein
MNMADQWRQILAHLKRLQSEKSAPEHHGKRRRSRQRGGPSKIIDAYANLEMKHRQQHRG